MLLRKDKSQTKTQPRVFSQRLRTLDGRWLTVAFYTLIIGLGLLVIWSQKDYYLDSDSVSYSEEADFRPLDSLNSPEIAYSLAIAGHYREVTWINLQVRNSRDFTNVASGSLPIVEKPAVINSTVRTRKDILNYIVSPGDTVVRLAQEFNVSADSIRWSNGLTSNNIEPGETILIPPSGLSGVVYTVREDDNLQSLSNRYNFSSTELLSFNDLDDFDSLTPGELIFIPDANQVVARQAIPTFLAQAITVNNQSRDDDTTGSCYGCRPVQAGEVVGKLGNTGWSTGPHLHIEILNNNGGRYNPWVFIRQNRLVWPVAQERHFVSQIYHSGHLGLDIADKEGVDILAVADGELIYRGCLWEYDGRWSTFGVIIDHGSYYSLSIHLQAPNNPIYQNCSINLRSQYGTPSIDYTADR